MTQQYWVRGIRGAISVDENTSENIRSATKELLEAVLQENDLILEDVASIFFTVTNDLNADFPAYAARELGWSHIPLLCANEIDVPSSMGKIIRILVHVNTTRGQKEIVHCYLKEAAKLRPDLADKN